MHAVWVNYAIPRAAGNEVAGKATLASRVARPGRELFRHSRVMKEPQLYLPFALLHYTFLYPL